MTPRLVCLACWNVDLVTRVTRLAGQGYQDDARFAGQFTDRSGSWGRRWCRHVEFRHFAVHQDHVVVGLLEPLQGSTTVAGYSGYELRFNAFANKGTANEVPYWGRVIIIASRGVGWRRRHIRWRWDIGRRGRLFFLQCAARERQGHEHEGKSQSQRHGVHAQRKHDGK